VVVRPPLIPLDVNKQKVVVKRVSPTLQKMIMRRLNIYRDHRMDRDARKENNDECARQSWRVQAG